MALPSINVGSFTGWVKIVTNQFKENQLELYITKFREDYLRQIIGGAAYRDIEQQTRTKWTDLLNGVDYLDSENKRKYHKGLVNPLIYLIYFEFTRDNFTPTQPGKVKTFAENSERVENIEVLEAARSRHNEAVRTVNSSTGAFLEANNIFEQNVTSSVDNLDGTYILSISVTKYLEAGETVFIDGFQYDVLSATADVNIVIDAGVTGLDFTNMLITWEPYKDVDYCPLQISGI